MERRIIHGNGQDILYELYRKQVKNINLNVRPDMKVVVSANDKVPSEYIDKFVKDRAGWILTKIDYFKDARPEDDSAKEYVSGETFKYLGKQLRLKVEQDEREVVKYFLSHLYLSVKDKTDDKRKKNLVDNWFRQRARIVFSEALAKVYPALQKYGVAKPEIMIRTMKARWGSCVRDKGIILLNYELIKAPRYCIEYVVLHELIHFLHSKHDVSFHSLMTVLMPDWQIRKQILDEEVIRGL
jgi:predicted metal-dependent hydrolase